MGQITSGWLVPHRNQAFLEHHGGDLVHWDTAPTQQGIQRQSPPDEELQPTTTTSAPVFFFGGVSQAEWEENQQE